MDPAGAIDRMVEILDGVGFAPAPAIGIRLEPFVRPGVCVAQVIYPANAAQHGGFLAKSG